MLCLSVVLYSCCALQQCQQHAFLVVSTTFWFGLVSLLANDALLSVGMPMYVLSGKSRCEALDQLEAGSSWLYGERGNIFILVPFGGSGK